MKATVREYTVKKKVVVNEIDEDEAKKIAVLNPYEGGYPVSKCGWLLISAVDAALEADRAEELRKDTEDVPF
jgi:hypothetical protein